MCIHTTARTYVCIINSRDTTHPPNTSIHKPTGQAYTLLCRLAPLEGVGVDGSIELFEDEDEMTEAFAAWISSDPGEDMCIF